MTKYENLMKDLQVKRWHGNLKARSVITAEVYLRTLGLYCELNHTDPDRIIRESGTKEFKDSFRDFVRDLESKGKAGSYIVRFKKVLSSWLRFNDIKIEFNVNIKDMEQSPTLDGERVPTKDEMSRILRKGTSRARVSMALMAYSGLRPESLGDHLGSDGIRLKDFREIKISSNGVEFEKSPAMLLIRYNLSKGRNQYFTFVPDEALIYIKEYIQERISHGEAIGPDTTLMGFEKGKFRTNDFLRTQLITRDIRDSITLAGLKMRPYVLRAYFATALDIAESKGMISHPWRMFFMGHKGDIESRYSTNKNLPPDMIEEMRSAYAKCERLLTTTTPEVTESEVKRDVRTQILLALGYSQDDIEKTEIGKMSNDDFQKMVRDRLLGSLVDNGNRQKVIPVKEIEIYIGKGFEFVASIPGNKAIMRLP